MAAIDANRGNGHLGKRNIRGGIGGGVKSGVLFRAAVSSHIQHPGNDASWHPPLKRAAADKLAPNPGDIEKRV